MGGGWSLSVYFFPNSQNTYSFPTFLLLLDNITCLIMLIPYKCYMYTIGIFTLGVRSYTAVLLSFYPPSAAFVSLGLTI